MWQYLRKTLISPIAITLAGAIVLYILVPEIIRAREMERHIRCSNRLFQHTGWHPADVVEIDRNSRVIDVRSCPLCSDPEHGMSFVVVDESVVEYLENDESVPDSTIQEAEQRLKVYRELPRYRELRETFGSVTDE